jgi:hypothetical protein
MTLTATQIKNLNNSMSAFQDAAVGTYIDAFPANLLSGYKFARGVTAITADTQTIASGLNTLVAVVITLQSDPTTTHQSSTVNIGNQAGTPVAGSFIVKSWKSTGVGDPTLIAATTPWATINWIAMGT